MEKGQGKRRQTEILSEKGGKTRSIERRQSLEGHEGKRNLPGQSNSKQGPHEEETEAVEDGGLQ